MHAASRDNARQQRVIYQDAGVVKGAFTQDIRQSKSTHKTNALLGTC